MKKGILKAVGILGLSFVMFVSMAVSVSAADISGSDNDSVKSSPLPVIEEPEETAGDYWTDLEDRDVTQFLDKDSSVYPTGFTGYYGIFPKYLFQLNDSRIYNKAKYNESLGINEFLSTGITDDNGNNLSEFPHAFDGPDPKHPELPALYDYSEDVLKNKDDNIMGIPEKDQYYRNPLKFTADNLLKHEEITDPSNKLQIWGDLSAEDSKDSSAVDTYHTGDPLTLDFSLNASWFKRYINGLCLSYTWGGQNTPDNYTSRSIEAKAVSDSGLVFTLELPKGVEVSKNLKASSLEGFADADITSGTDDKTGNTRLVITYKNNEPISEDQTLPALLKNLDAKNLDDIKISVLGLSVASDAEEKQYSVRGTASGYYDLVTQMNDVGAFHHYFYFAAKQGDNGRDSALDDAHKYMIQYSFKVSKPFTPDTPYVPSTPTEPEQPQKHEVTIHEENPTSDKPETTTKITVDDQGKVEKPAQDPVRPGYTFDGWYSDPECTIPFDFSKPVTGDLHIYAKWNKNVKPQTAKKVTGILLPKAIANGSSRQTVTWTPLTNVDGYYVYEANCNTPKKTYHFKKVADVKASAPRVYKQSGLKKGVAYKYYVAAYQIKNGKKKVVKKSLSVHSIAGNIMRKHVNYTNVKSVSVRKNAVTLKVGKTYRIQPSVKGVYSGCAILQKDHAAMFRYVYIKDGKNISVSSSGTVKALKAGKCNVYVLGTNGVRTKVAVTVVK